MYSVLALVSLLLSRTVYAQDYPPKTLCSLDDFVISIPPAQSNITVPSGAKTVFLAEGLGTQNYTCSSSGIYTCVGAVAELLDISCLVSNQSVFPFVKRDRAPFPDSDAVWDHEAEVRALLGPSRLRLGQHYFIAGADGTVVPKFDFTADLFKNDSTKFILNNKIASSSAPNKTQDVDWLKLANIGGSLADFTFRFDTHFGQPLTNCTPGSPPIQVRYAAKYAFLKNSTSSATNAATTGAAAKPLGALNAALSSDSVDPDNLKKLLDYAPIALGLLGATTVLSLILVIFAMVSLCGRRRNSTPTRSAAYQPLQLPRAKTPADGSYHDEPEPYGA